MSLIHPVILSGGAGSRLWPLSRSLFPKQLLALVGERSLIQDTMLRARDADFAAPLIICNSEHRFLVAEQMREVGISPQAIVLEPAGRNTAPAAAVAALMVAQQDPEALLLLMPADHIVRNRTAFLQAVAQAAAAARQDHLVTFGITPDSAETGYGYIRRGAALKDLEGSFAVARFVEKPDAATAAGYVASGDYSWNSGMFLFKASAFLAELGRLEPDLLAHCRTAVTEGKQDLDFLRLQDAAFLKAKSVSIDYAVMEHAEEVVMIEAPFDWDDLGSWQALARQRGEDKDGNTVVGRHLGLNTSGTIIYDSGDHSHLIVTVGLEDLIVVRTHDATLVAHKKDEEKLREVVKMLHEQGRREHL